MPPRKPAEQAEDKEKANVDTKAAEGTSEAALAKAASPDGAPADASPSSAATDTSPSAGATTEEAPASSEAASASVEGGATQEAPASSDSPEPASAIEPPAQADPATEDASAKDKSEELSEDVSQVSEQAPVEAKLAEVAAEGMASDEFLAQKGIFQTTDELIRKIRAMPEGAEKEEAIAVFEKALAQAPTAAEPLIKSGGRLVRVRRFFGSFHDAVFMEDQAKEWGEARGVSDATLEILRSEFPGAEVEVIE